MIRALEMARRVLLTDPVTGHRLSAIECASLFCGLLIGCAVVMAMIAIAMGLGAGQ